MIRNLLLILSILALSACHSHAGLPRDTDPVSASVSAPATYFAPDDNVQAVILKLVNSGTAQILVAAYGVQDPDLTAALIARKKAGVDVRVVCDKVQAAGKLDAAQLQQMRDAGIPVEIGTSSKHHIMHLKVLIVDQRTVFSGSYNLTDTAGLEDNVADVTIDTDRARLFVAKWQKVWDFMATEPQL